MTHEWQEDGYVIKCSVCHIAKTVESAKTSCETDKTLAKTAD